jgi:hypothetical protein
MGRRPIVGTRMVESGLREKRERVVAWGWL